MKPVLFYLGSFPVHSFGLLVGLGFVVGLWWAARRAQSIGIAREAIYDLGPWLLFAGLIGARTLYVISYWKRDFAGQPISEIFRIWNGGLVFYGGLILAIAVAIGRLTWLKLPLWSVGDCLAPSIALAHVFGRLGCFMNGCCYGVPTTLPWGLRFPIDRIPHGHPVHPTQLYEAGLNLAFALALAGWFPKRKFPGQIFALYLAGYAIIRAVTELFRGDYDHISAPLQGILTPGQAVSLGILFASLGLWLRLRNQPLPTAPAKS